MHQSIPCHVYVCTLHNIIGFHEFEICCYLDKPNVFSTLTKYPLSVCKKRPHAMLSLSQSMNWHGDRPPLLMISSINYEFSWLLSPIPIIIIINIRSNSQKNVEPHLIFYSRSINHNTQYSNSKLLI